jgi:hypothetical protein
MGPSNTSTVLVRTCTVLVAFPSSGSSELEQPIEAQLNSATAPAPANRTRPINTVASM